MIPFADPVNSGAGAGPVLQSQFDIIPRPATTTPKCPSGEDINLPEIATESEEEDSDASEGMPVPKWAQPDELESILRQQEGAETDHIFGRIAPFSLEEAFRSDKHIKKFRNRTSSANWSGQDGLTKEEKDRDNEERRRLRMNGGWTMNMG